MNTLVTMEAWSWWYPTYIIIFFFLFLFLFRKNGRNRVGPSQWPVVGMLPGLLVNLHRLYDFVTSLLQESGGTFMFRGPWLMGVDFLFTCDPANAKHMYTTHFANYAKGADFPEIFEEVLGRGIITSDGEMWARQRKMAQAHMASLDLPSRMARSSRDKVESAALPMLEGLARLGGAFDLQELVKRFCMDLVGGLVLGKDLGCLARGFPRVPFLVALAEAEEVALYRHVVPKAWWRLMRWLNVGEEMKMATAMSVIDQFLAGCIEEKRRRSTTTTTRGEEEANDLLTSYMYHNRDVMHDHKEESTIASSSYFGSDNFLRDTLISLLAPGTDSPSTALSWFFWQVSKSPIVEKKILEELREVVVLRRRSNDCDRSSSSSNMVAFDAEETEGLVYLHAALCESLRLYPSIPFNHKMAVKEDVLPSGHRVRPGTMVIYSLYSMARIHKFWGKDCMEFKPERWIDPSSGKLKHLRPHDFLAFHTGPRSCPGKNVALIQMKAIVSAVIYNFHVELVDGCVVEPRIAMVFQMKHGLQVRVTKREQEEEEEEEEEDR